LEGHAELYRELAARVDDDENSLVAEVTRLREALETMPCKCEPELPDVGEYECIRCVALKEKP